jgi:hypothetical protein
MITQQYIDENYYTTTDLGCAAGLVVAGSELLELDRSNVRRVVFIFNRSGKLSDDFEAYWRGDLSIDAKSYFEALKWLKARVYNG